MFYRRRLPHLYRDDQPVFLTWRLYGSLPPNRYFPTAGVASGKVFAVLDRLLGEARTGPVYLRRPAIADMVVEVIHHCANVLGRHATCVCSDAKSRSHAREPQHSASAGHQNTQEFYREAGEPNAGACGKSFLARGKL